MISRARQAASLLLLGLVSLLAADGQAQQQAAQQQQEQQQPEPTLPQQPEEQQQPPIFRADINFVRVDIIVTDGDGNPVTDLEADDFEVLEDGTPQTIESFRLIRITGIPEPGAEPARPIRNAFDAEREAAREDVRLFAIFLDDYHVRRGNDVRLREALISFIQTQLAPTDMVAIMYPLTPLAGVNATRNHEAIVSELARFEGRKYEYEARNEFERRYSYYPTSTVERVRNEVSLSALKALVTHLGGLREGRKALILVSEGYTNYLPPQLRDRFAGSPGFGSQNRRDPFVGDNQREQTAEFFANSDLVSDLRTVFDAANRNNTAIYAIDPRGIAPFEFDSSQRPVSFRTDARALQSTMNTLRILAAETDGRAIVNQNDFEPGLRQMLRDLSAYYLIGYNSSAAPSDGKFHEIKVRLKRDGLRVRARKGYWAFTAEDAARALAPTALGPPSEIQEALAAIVEPPRGRYVRTWVGSARGEDGKTRVTFIWEAEPLVPGQRREELGRVSLTASSDLGDPYYRGRIPDGAGASVRGPGAPNQPSRDAAASGRVVFEADPGAMHMMVAVEGTAGEVLDKEMKEVSIPDLTGTDVALSTPAVIRVRNMLEMRTLAGDREAVPTPGRTFRRTDRLLIRFEAYAPGSSVPTITATLLNRSGSPMSEIPVQPPVEGRPHQLELSLANLARGEYLVEISALIGDSEATELVAFRVVS